MNIRAHMYNMYVCTCMCICVYIHIVLHLNPRQEVPAVRKPNHDYIIMS